MAPRLGEPKGGVPGWREWHQTLGSWDWQDAGHGEGAGGGGVCLHCTLCFQNPSQAANTGGRERSQRRPDSPETRCLICSRSNGLLRPLGARQHLGAGPSQAAGLARGSRGPRASKPGSAISSSALS